MVVVALPFASRLLVLTAIAGIATGALTLVGQRSLPGVANQLANIGAPWLAVAFWLGGRAQSNREAIVVGATALLFALVGYYSAAQLLLSEGGATTATIVGFWAAVALIGGPTFGLAGRWFVSGGSRERAIAIRLLGSALVAQGLYQVWVAWTPVVGLVEIAVGSATPIVLGRSRKDRGRAFAWLIPALGAGIAAFVALAWLSGFAS